MRSLLILNFIKIGQPKIFTPLSPGGTCQVVGDVFDLQSNCGITDSGMGQNELESEKIAAGFEAANHLPQILLAIDGLHRPITPLSSKR